MIMYNISGIVPAWNGRFEIKNTLYPGHMGTTQFIDLTEYALNGEISQIVELPTSSTYILAAKAKADSNAYESYHA